MKIFIIALLFLTACADKKKNIVIKPPEEMYKEAIISLKKGNYEEAATKFETIDTEYPFTEDSNNGLIMASYAFYKAKQFEESLRVIEYFKRLNFYHPEASYLEYIKFLNYYDRIESPEKAINFTKIAENIANNVLETYSDTKYSEDIKAKKAIIRDYLANNEMYLLRYYLENKNILGAINHLDMVLKNYTDTIYIAEALFRGVEIYTHLSYEKKVEEYFKILEDNYNFTIWHKYAKELRKKNEKK